MPDCNACRENRRGNTEFTMVGVMAAANRRTFIALIVSIVLLFLSNAIWLYAWMQYDYTSEETVYTQDGEGLNIIGDSNNTNFRTDAEEENQNP